MWNQASALADFILLLGSCVYYLRVPLAAITILAALPAVALRCRSVRPLLAGLFDVSGLSGGKNRPAVLAIFAVTLTALGAAWSAFLPFRLVMAHGAERFGHPWLNHSHFSYVWFSVFTAAAVPAIWGACVETARRGGVARKPLAWGVLSGAALGALLFGLAYAIEPLFEGSFVVRWLIGLLSLRTDFGAGYIGPGPSQPDSAILLPSHGLALALSVLMAGVYAAAGWKRRERIPALACVHLLVTVLSWGLAAAAFFLDLYHVPVLAALILWFCLMSIFPRSDNFYTLISARTLDPLYPSEVLSASASEKVIVVAASGGGIQAAAWTAQVLAGLERECAASGSGFAPSVRLISAVSGGSVGSMYFVNAYESGGVPPNRLETIIQRAETSTLEEIAWGLTYPDFCRNVFPLLVPKDCDRGNALEDAWKAIDPNLRNPLGAWRGEVRSGERPAVIFNATIVDSGQRLILSTSDFENHPGRAGSFEGRRNFYDPAIYPGKDVSIATAVRLSASFPYVTPAARADDAGANQERFHVADGGYYDDFGVASLLEWLDQALEKLPGTKTEILILQIRDAAPASAGLQARHRGWIYQAFAPLVTLMNVRDTAQLSYDEFAVKTLQGKYSCKGVRIGSAAFEFPGTHPPLSWHLTSEDKSRIESAWRTDLGVRESIRSVKEFLASRPV